jgi:hypothetical protein
MSDIDPIWESEFILHFLSKDRAKNKKELSYLARYKSLLSEYYNTKNESESVFYENELAKLENTETIKEIVAREGPKDLILEMTFAKTTLNVNEERQCKKIKKKKRVLPFVILSIAIALFFAAATLLILSVSEQEQNQVNIFEFEKELTNLTEIMKGEDILRYPENYDGKQMNFCGYVFDYTESTIFITPIKLEDNDIEGIKDGGAFTRYTCREKYMPIEVPYTNNKSPRLLIGDCITFTGTIHSKLVDGEITKRIDNITNVKIVDNKNE